ncbi:glutaredoxin [Actinotalea sp. Marseille-Q4924]|uniref:glutaredoxin n=1 Tax=Actinotalea sp. Marseille-Q4924 TaxID=2866571 RepID=UPI001CE3F613|nr:glutaredoxin [Actinotalea sp. Marseille-Q4924]
MTSPPESAPVHVTVVHAPACHLCEDAVDALADLGQRWPLTVRVVELESTEGALLVAQHRPAMNPLVVVDGAYFSSGRLPRKKLVKLLTGRVLPSASASAVSV